LTIDVGPTEYVFHHATFANASAGSGGGAGVPQETLSLNYTSVEIKYVQQKPEAPSRSAINASMINPNVRPVLTNAQVFVDAAPSDQFSLISLDRIRPDTAVLQLRNAPTNGFFASNKAKNTKVAVKASAGQFLEITMSNCIISSYSRNADGTATATLHFSLYNGPVSVRQ
ncbi:MAG TPA: hypothetical protein VI391_10150, partial [Thermoanaerobaculia bacterium]